MDTGRLGFGFQEATTFLLQNYNSFWDITTQRIIHRPSGQKILATNSIAKSMINRRTLCSDIHSSPVAIIARWMI
jgi:hypothetical protein